MSNIWAKTLYPCSTETNLIIYSAILLVLIYFNLKFTQMKAIFPKMTLQIFKEHFSLKEMEGFKKRS